MILPAGAPGTRSPALSASSAQSCRHRSPGCKKGDETAGRWCCRASQVRDGRAPSFSFGLVADVQYGKKEDKNSVSVVRRYSEAAGKLRLAVEAWKGLIKEGGDLSFVLHLGDIIDGNDSPVFLLRVSLHVHCSSAPSLLVLAVR